MNNWSLFFIVEEKGNYFITVSDDELIDYLKDEKNRSNIWKIQRG
jgi:hypothetical protein